MPLKYAIETSEHGLNVLHITFTGHETIEIELTDFFKDLTYAATLYDQINGYVASLPTNSQLHIYEVFYKLYSTEHQVDFEDQGVVEALENRIAHATDLLNYENFKIWLRHRSDTIIFPDNILHDYIYDPDMNTTQEKTYIKSEYTDLIAYIIFIRMLSPLYIDYYNHVKQVTPHYHYKIFMLFARSELYECPEATKLRTYIDVNQKTLIGVTKNENLILTAGLSDDDILDSMMSEVVFSKLLTIDFCNKKCNIISFVFQTIRFKGNFASPDGSVIRSRNVREDASVDDMSMFENYRKTSNIAIGTVMEIQHALSSVDQLLLGLGNPNFNHQLYQEELKNLSKFLEFTIDDLQTYLLGWFLNKIINPRALFYIEYRKLAELILFAKVVLLGEGHTYVATLLSSYKSHDQNLMSVVIRNTVNKQTVEALSPYYHFVQDEGKMSVVEKTISELSKEISNSLWIPIGSPEQLKLVSMMGQHLETPSNLNEIMFNYVQYVNRDN